MSKSIDVVYPLGRGSSWMNNELRFSLRSLETYGIGIRNIYIIGECPSWIQNIYHVHADDPYGPENADGNIISKVLKACQIPDLTDEFLFINDDHLLLRQTNISEIPAYNKGTIQDFVRGKSKQGIYLRRLIETLRVLREHNLPTLHYDCHVPILINKNLFPGVVKNFDYHIGVGYGMKSLYGNSLGLESPFLSDLNIKSNMTTGAIEDITTNKTHMAFNDRGLNHDLMIFLEKRFNKPSKFEKMDKTRSLLEQAEQWLENPESHAEGVQLYVALGSNRHLMSLARADKVGRTQEKIKSHLRTIVEKAKSQGKLKGVEVKHKAAPAAPSKPESKGKGKTLKIDDNKHVRYEDLPENMKAFFNRNKEITREMTPIHEKLKLMGDSEKQNPERKALAKQIAEMDKERKANWETIDNWWKESGKEPVQKEVVKASGSLTKEEIDAIEDPSVKKESELLRIKANQNYIKRFSDSKKKKQVENVKLRMAELDAWGVKY